MNVLRLREVKYLAQGHPIRKEQIPGCTNGPPQNTAGMQGRSCLLGTPVLTSERLPEGEDGDPPSPGPTNAPAQAKGAPSHVLRAGRGYLGASGEHLRFPVVGRVATAGCCASWTQGSADTARMSRLYALPTADESIESLN